MAIDKDTVKYVARLARMELSAKDLEKFSRQLKGILGFIDKLKQLDIKDTNPTSHILSVNNIFRQDKRHESLSSEQALKNAPQKEGKFFGVPRVIE